MTFFVKLKHHFQPPAGEEELIETEPFLLAAGEVLVIIGNELYFNSTSVMYFNIKNIFNH